MTSDRKRTTSKREASVVLIHGQPGSVSDFRDLMSRLPREMRVIAYDRPGWGSNALPARDLNGNAEYTAELITNSNTHGAILVGYSYGTAVALRVAVDFPELVSSLVLISPVGTVSALSILDRLFGAPGKLWEQGSWSFPSSSRRLSKLRSFASFQKEQVNMEGDLERLSKEISSIRLPVELIVGLDDFINSIGGTFLLYDKLSNARLSLLKNVGHLVLLQAPDKVSLVVTKQWREFFERAE